VRRTVRVVESPECVTPVTLGVVRPAIILPASMQSWSPAGKRLVLFHELHHVRTGDSFLLAIAYVICSLFWYVPLVWAAYARLYLEQEKTCDAVVLESGAEPDAYASCILDTAQFSREPALPAGLGFSGRRRCAFKDRIMAIIRARKTVRHGLLLFGLAVLMLAATAMMGASGLDAPGTAGKKYGSLYLREYRAKTADEATILAMLTQYESAFNSHDLSKFLSLFARDGVYHPCGVSAKLPIASKDCQDLIVYNFGFLKFERYFDPRISVNGRRAVVNLLLETGDYLADYTFLLSKPDRGWIVSATDYASVRWKG
jgi:BlaR1 peptidase M56